MKKIIALLFGAACWLVACSDETVPGSTNPVNPDEPSEEARPIVTNDTRGW